MFHRHSNKELSPKAIFNKFMNFLKSSMWNIPIATFMEQRSVVFERKQGDLILYKEIHKEFASTVDALMEGFCDDIHIKPDQLVTALKHQDNNHKLSSKERCLLEPVVAAQNFDVFVPMMVRKNVELQIQALEMIEFLCGVVPAVLCIEGDDLDEEELAKALVTGFEPDEYDRYILVQVLRKSKAEFENDEKIRQEAKQQLEEAMKASLQEKERLAEHKQRAESEINKALVKTTDTMDKKSSTVDAAPPEIVTEVTEPKKNEARKLSKVRRSGSRSLIKTDQKEDEQVGKEATNKVENKTGKTISDIHALLQEPTHIPEGDIEARAAYFREKRDELLRMKRAMREKQFQVIAETTEKDRPRTAKAARGVMSGKGRDHGAVNEEILEARRALAAKLKDEMEHTE